MTVEEIYKELSSHMVEGMMVHQELMNCYFFLGLEGYAKCHEYHYLSETKGFIELCRYYSEHHRGILGTNRIEAPDIIPSSWFANKKESVDNETRRKAIIAAFDEWVRWESETKELYEKAYAELFAAGHIASANFVKKFIVDVDDELAESMGEKLHKEAVGYDMTSIVEEQEKLVKLYRKKLD